MRAEPEARTPDDTSTVQPRERTTESAPVRPLIVFLFLPFGLATASILAWLVMKDDVARGECLVHRSDKQSQADWIDDFLANWRQSLTGPNSENYDSR